MQLVQEHMILSVESHLERQPPPPPAVSTLCTNCYLTSIMLTPPFFSVSRKCRTLGIPMITRENQQWCDVMWCMAYAPHGTLCYIILFSSSISIRYHIAVQYSVSKFNILYLVATPFSMPVFDVCPWFILAICYVCLLYMKVPWSKAPAALGATYIIKCKILIPDPNLPGKAQWWGLTYNVPLTWGRPQQGEGPHVVIGTRGCTHWLFNFVVNIKGLVWVVSLNSKNQAYAGRERRGSEDAIDLIALKDSNRPLHDFRTFKILNARTTVTENSFRQAFTFFLV